MNVVGSVFAGQWVCQRICSFLLLVSRGLRGVVIDPQRGLCLWDLSKGPYAYLIGDVRRAGVDRLIPGTKANSVPREKGPSLGYVLRRVFDPGGQFF
jgi:hypothetical protein